MSLLFTNIFIFRRCYNREIKLLVNNIGKVVFRIIYKETEKY